MLHRSQSTWSRLKHPHAHTDPLDAVGLPSKGDNRYFSSSLSTQSQSCASTLFVPLAENLNPRLLDLKTQESYHTKIVARYMGFCAAAGRDTDALSRAFASMSLETSVGKKEATLSKAERLTGVAGVATGTGEKEVAATKELGTILMAMRKLREAIVASHRTDLFAQRAYVFIIRAAILTSTYESYHPALLHLLGEIHAKTPLSASEVGEFVGYRILDLACRQGDYGEAFAVVNRWRFRNDRVLKVLRALVRDDWVAFWRLKEEVDGYQRAFLGWAEEGVRKHALKCLGSSYLAVDKGYVERSGGRNWDELKAFDKLGWELEGNHVTIRRMRRR